MTKLFQIGDTVRATYSLGKVIVGGRLYVVRSVRSVDGESNQDIRLEGVMGRWFAGSAFTLEAQVPPSWQLGMFVRRIKAGHNGVVEGGVYQIVAINRSLGLIKLDGIREAFRATSFQPVDAAAPAPKPAAPSPAANSNARTVGWKNERGEITTNPSVAATWITTGSVSNVQRVYVEAA
ncbi:hypothetical protein SAMN02983003_0597 [Devosia enhydra]|uniref:Uncharacterized protein n=1 Tax=Devosia enhydra TaxID=665118 RepID=A0A1K2HTN3_9HYPH|nr:hypothetical protein [Devosia enhydra]SFZ81618.1 hypothetical protein SAMN02983003_0597 [Devosia enhydra]